MYNFIYLSFKLNLKKTEQLTIKILKSNAKIIFLKAV